MQTLTEPMDASKQFCPNSACSARGQKGQGNIIIHDRQRQRYRCKVCKGTESRPAGNDVRRLAQTEGADRGCGDALDLRMSSPSQCACSWLGSAHRSRL